MSARQRRAGSGRSRRSTAQRQGSAAMTEVMKGWEDLSDAERQAWRVQASTRRLEGVTHFKQVNLRRLRRGEELSRLPLHPNTYDSRPILKGLVIRNCGDRLILQLELRRAPTAPTTVWGSRRCNRGLERPDKCPRLGWLSAGKDGICDISGLYYQKHGEYVQTHNVYLAGKRIFIRTRREVDEGVALYEEISALVPPPEGKAGR